MNGGGGSCAGETSCVTVAIIPISDSVTMVRMFSVGMGIPKGFIAVDSEATLKKRCFMGRVLAITGILLTVLYAFFAWWLVGDRIQTLRCMELNAVGDFLAGAFGPVAILWLVLGFFQQGIELRQGTAALLLQAGELRSSVDQQKESLGVSREQFALQKANTDLEHERLASSLEPKFSLSGRYTGQGNQGIDFDIVIANGGHTITCVEVAFNGSVLHKIDVLATLNKTVVRVNFSDYNVISSATIVIRYLNGLEQFKMRRFVVAFDLINTRGSWDVSVTPKNGYPVNTVHA
ncbi:hypothetical protein [Pseudomonas sp. MYb118]|uniref:hypothetical protein n=1 Tax=Pseudomonas sp. MYb118 TaxID=1848720 RepID=UPI0034CDAEE5